MIERQEKIKKVNDIEILILSSTIDYSTDLVCYALEKKHEKYLRMNRDEFSEYQIIYDFERSEMLVVVENETYKINNISLKAVYFRAPTHLRVGKALTVEEQLSRGQWNSFMRNLVVFTNARWVNHPVDTYRAENKMLQLDLAKKIGLKTPKTVICNTLPKEIHPDRKYVVKSLDTALFYHENNELFTYTNILAGKELMGSQLNTAPVILQEFLDNKIDLRITVIGKKIFSAKVIANGKGIYGDWRVTKKELLEYIPVEIPQSLVFKIIKFMKEMKLNFAGIDMALIGDGYYFIESNPTGEWGWLVRTTGFPIDIEISNFLTER